MCPAFVVGMDKPSIFRSLRSDHDTARRLMSILSKTHGNSRGRQELFVRLRAELLEHAAAEESTLYAAMTENDGTADSAQHSVNEHRELEELLMQLSHIGYDSPHWLSVLERLIDRAKHHMKEEEKETFMSARNIITEEDSAALAERYASERARLKETRDISFRDAETGVAPATLEARSAETIRKQAAERGIPTDSQTKSELITHLREQSGSVAW